MDTPSATEGRFTRIVAGLVLLPVMAAATFALIWAIAEEDPVMFLSMFAISIYFGAIYAAIQAILYSLLMEFCVWRVVGVNSPAILVSSLLGLVCGLSVSLMLGEFLPTLLFAGFGAGLATGAILYRMRKPTGRLLATPRAVPGAGTDPE